MGVSRGTPEPPPFPGCTHLLQCPSKTSPRRRVEEVERTLQVVYEDVKDMFPLKLRYALTVVSLAAGFTGGRSESLGADVQGEQPGLVKSEFLYESAPFPNVTLRRSPT